MRDALRRPLAEAELGAMEAGLRRTSHAVAHLYLGMRASMWSYNALIAAWEPVLEPWDLIVKGELNTSKEVRQHHGACPFVVLLYLQ